MEILGRIATGNDPIEQQGLNKTTTFMHFFEHEYMQHYALVHKKSHEYDMYIFTSHLRDIHYKKFNTISAKDVETLHNRLCNEKSVYIANNALKLISTVYNKAIEWGHKVINPAYKIKKFKIQSRDRFLQSSELPRFFKALNETLNTDMKDYFYILLLTGVRKTNALSMQWSEIDFYFKQWTIPETKNGESVTVNLHEKALEILNLRKQAIDLTKSKWVFPSKSSASGHIEDPKASWINT